MTPEVAARPKTALDLLFGENGDPAAPLTRLILSADAGQDLGRALEHAAKSTRAAAAREVTAAAAGLLDVSLVGVLAEGWREHHDLTSAARRTLAVPGSTELVQLAEHQVSVANHPYVTVLVDGRQVATVHLGLSFVFDVSAVVAGISAGRLVAIHPGRCDVTATLAVEGADVLTRHARLDMPGVIALSPGIRLLAAADYPAEGGHPPATPWAEGLARQAEATIPGGITTADHAATAAPQGGPWWKASGATSPSAAAPAAASSTVVPAAAQQNADPPEPEWEATSRPWWKQ